MTRTAKRTGQWKPWQLILRGVAVPLMLLLGVAALSGMVAIRQWVPQTGIRYLSYLTAAVFYLLAPLPMIKWIGKYPLRIWYPMDSTVCTVQKHGLAAGGR